MVPSIQNLDLHNKRVFIRVDFNVPINNELEVTDDTRIRATIPTIQLAIEKGAKVILASHLGRPKGKVDNKYSLKPVIRILSNFLGKEIFFTKDCVGDETLHLTQSLKPGEVLLLENLRFHAEEEKNDENFSKSLAALAEVYINDAFGTAHRAHASTVGMTKYFTEKAAGLLMEKELKYLGKAIHSPDHPFVAILGGAKVSDKIEIIENLIKTADTLLIGGAMAYTFLKANGIEIGKSLVEDEKLNLAKELEVKAQARGVKLLLPTDHVIGDLSSPQILPTIVSISQTPSTLSGYDIGPNTIESYSKEIQLARTIIWNGPMGIFENPLYANGTNQIAHAVASCKGTTIIGGGDSVAAINQAGLTNKISHVSTGGGASLEFLAGIELPGVIALSNH